VSRKKHSIKKSAGDTAPPTTWGQDVATMSAVGAMLGGGVALLMVLRVTRNTSPLLDELTIPAWEAVAILIGAGAVAGALAGVAYPLTRLGLPGRLAFGALVGALASVPFGLVVNGLSFPFAAICAAVGAFATAGSALQEWMKRPRA
jgi:hypothetical protein